jgi:hypothetical protein
VVFVINRVFAGIGGGRRGGDGGRSARASLGDSKRGDKNRKKFDFSLARVFKRTLFMVSS